MIDEMDEMIIPIPPFLHEIIKGLKDKKSFKKNNFHRGDGDMNITNKVNNNGSIPCIKNAEADSNSMLMDAREKGTTTVKFYIKIGFDEGRRINHSTIPNLVPESSEDDYNNDDQNDAKGITNSSNTNLILYSTPREICVKETDTTRLVRGGGGRLIKSGKASSNQQPFRPASANAGLGSSASKINNNLSKIYLFDHVFTPETSLIENTSYLLKDAIKGLFDGKTSVFIITGTSMTEIFHSLYGKFGSKHDIGLLFGVILWCLKVLETIPSPTVTIELTRYHSMTDKWNLQNLEEYSQKDTYKIICGEKSSLVGLRDSLKDIYEKEIAKYNLTTKALDEFVYQISLRTEESAAHLKNKSSNQFGKILFVNTQNIETSSRQRHPHHYPSKLPSNNGLNENHAKQFYQSYMARVLGYSNTDSDDLKQSRCFQMMSGIDVAFLIHVQDKSSPDVQLLNLAILKIIALMREQFPMSRNNNNRNKPNRKLEHHHDKRRWSSSSNEYLNDDVSSGYEGSENYPTLVRRSKKLLLRDHRLPPPPNGKCMIARKRDNKMIERSSGNTNETRYMDNLVEDGEARDRIIIQPGKATLRDISYTKKFLKDSSIDLCETERQIRLAPLSRQDYLDERRKSPALAVNGGGRRRHLAPYISSTPPPKGRKFSFRQRNYFLDRAELVGGMPTPPDSKWMNGRKKLQLMGAADKDSSSFDNATTFYSSLNRVHLKYKGAEKIKNSYRHQYYEDDHDHMPMHAFASNGGKFEDDKRMPSPRLTHNKNNDQFESAVHREKIKFGHVTGIDDNDTPENFQGRNVHSRVEKFDEIKFKLGCGFPLNPTTTINNSETTTTTTTTATTTTKTPNNEIWIDGPSDGNMKNCPNSSPLTRTRPTPMLQHIFHPGFLQSNKAEREKLKERFIKYELPRTVFEKVKKTTTTTSTNNNINNGCSHGSPDDKMSEFDMSVINVPYMTKLKSIKYYDDEDVGTSFRYNNNINNANNLRNIVPPNNTETKDFVGEDLPSLLINTTETLSSTYNNNSLKPVMKVDPYLITLDTPPRIRKLQQQIDIENKGRRSENDQICDTNHYMSMRDLHHLYSPLSLHGKRISRDNNLVVTVDDDDKGKNLFIDNELYNNNCGSSKDGQQRRQGCCSKGGQKYYYPPKPSLLGTKYINMSLSDITSIVNFNKAKDGDYRFQRRNLNNHYSNTANTDSPFKWDYYDLQENIERATPRKSTVTNQLMTRGLGSLSRRRLEVNDVDTMNPPLYQDIADLIPSGYNYERWNGIHSSIPPKLDVNSLEGLKLKDENLREIMEDKNIYGASKGGGGVKENGSSGYESSSNPTSNNTNNNNRISLEVEELFGLTHHSNNLEDRIPKISQYKISPRQAQTNSTTTTPIHLQTESRSRPKKADEISYGEQNFPVALNDHLVEEYDCFNHSAANLNCKIKKNTTPIITNELTAHYETIDKIQERKKKTKLVPIIIKEDMYAVVADREKGKIVKTLLKRSKREANRDEESTISWYKVICCLL